MNTVGVISERGVISYKVEVMSYVVHMMSYILWLCFHTYNGGCMIENLIVMTEIQWMCCQI